MDLLASCNPKDLSRVATASSRARDALKRLRDLARERTLAKARRDDYASMTQISMFEHRWKRL